MSKKRKMHIAIIVHATQRNYGNLLIILWYSDSFVFIFYVYKLVLMKEFKIYMSLPTLKLFMYICFYF